MTSISGTALPYDVHAEATGAAGLRAAGALDPTLITLDLGLPEINGDDVARHIRKVSNAPILMDAASPEPGGGNSYSSSALQEPSHACP